jgi:hypothetical protein
MLHAILSRQLSREALQSSLEANANARNPASFSTNERQASILKKLESRPIKPSQGSSGTLTADSTVPIEASKIDEARGSQKRSPTHSMSRREVTLWNCQIRPNLWSSSSCNSEPRIWRGLAQTTSEPVDRDTTIRGALIPARHHMERDIQAILIIYHKYLPQSSDGKKALVASNPALPHIALYIQNKRMILKSSKVSKSAAA